MWNFWPPGRVAHGVRLTHNLSATGAVWLPRTCPSPAVHGLQAERVLDVLLVVDDVQDEASYLKLPEADG